MICGVYLMICIIALLVFAVMSVFSAAYRPLAARAFDCVFRKLTLRPCDTGLDVEMKSAIISRILSFSPKAAKFVNANFEILSWAFTIITLASLALSLQAGFNWYYYGNCNGPQSTEFCIFNAFSQHNATVYPYQAKFNPVSMVENSTPSVEIIEFGCFSCPYTSQAEPLRRQLTAEFGGNISFYYRNFPLPTHPYSRETAMAAQCAYELRPWAYWRFHDLLFQEQDSIRATPAASINSSILDLAVAAGYSAEQFALCLSSTGTSAKVDADISAGIAANVAGTPTFFVRNANSTDKFMVISGPHPYSDVREVVLAALQGRTIDSFAQTAVGGSCPVDATPAN